jgi:hypothetical protein
MNQDQPPCEEALRYWLESGPARRWVESRQGRWGHDDWLALVESLELAGLRGLDQRALGLGLEELRGRYLNLRAWESSGGPRRWVAWRQGRWDHGDWLALLREVERSFGPVEPDALGLLLEEHRRRWANLRRLAGTGRLRRWVEDREGRWDHAAWLELLGELRRSHYWPLDPDAVGEALEELKAAWGNLSRWLAEGGARRWVARRRGKWDHDDWLALLAELRRQGVGPFEPDSLGQALEAERARYWRLRLWQQSGRARRWVEERDGRWAHRDWLALLAELQDPALGPLDPEAVAGVLEREGALYRQRRQRWAGAGDEAFPRGEPPPRVVLGAAAPDARAGPAPPHPVPA